MNMKNDKIICGKCGGENEANNTICQYCGQEFSKVVEGKHEEIIEIEIKKNDIDLLFKEKQNPYSQNIKCTYLYGILSILFGILSILIFAVLVFDDIWFAPISLFLSLFSYYFSILQYKRCYGCFALIGRTISIIAFCIIIVSILVYVLFVSVVYLII